MEVINKENARELINKIIRKVGYDVGGYSNEIEEDFKLTKDKKYKIYRGFVPNVCGEESYDLWKGLKELGFEMFFNEASYYWKTRNKISGLQVHYTEGDVDLFIKCEVA